MIDDDTNTDTDTNPDGRLCLLKEGIAGLIPVALDSYNSYPAKASSSTSGTKRSACFICGFLSLLEAPQETKDCLD